MDPFLANPFPSTALILDHEALPQEMQHTIMPSKLPITEETNYEAFHDKGLNIHHLSHNQKKKEYSEESFNTQEH